MPVNERVCVSKFCVRSSSKTSMYKCISMGNFACGFFYVNKLCLHFQEHQQIFKFNQMFF